MLEVDHMEYGTVTAFRDHLVEEERSEGTIEKYLRDVKAFLLWLDERPLDKVQLIHWKEHLMVGGYKPATINAMIASVNAYLRFVGREDCIVRGLRLQRSTFRSTDKELTAEEYKRLVETAHRLKRERLALLLETIGGTGIRVSVPAGKCLKNTRSVSFTMLPHI